MPVTRSLTSRQEGYVQDRTSGLNRSDAYRNHYSTANMSGKTVNEAACRLDKNSKVAARMLELNVATQATLAAKRVWDKERLLDEAETNLDGAREARQWASANGSLEFIGRATGLITDKQQTPTVPVTQIIINLAPGVAPPAGMVEATEYRELPAAEGGEDDDIGRADDA